MLRDEQLTCAKSSSRKIYDIGRPASTSHDATTPGWSNDRPLLGSNEHCSPGLDLFLFRDLTNHTAGVSGSKDAVLNIPSNDTPRTDNSPGAKPPGRMSDPPPTQTSEPTGKYPVCQTPACDGARRSEGAWASESEHQDQRE